jgi:ATP-dependent Lon protease
MTRHSWTASTPTCRAGMCPRWTLLSSPTILGLPTLLALCTALLEKSLRGGLVAVGGLNLGGALDPVYNAVNVAELAIEKGATTLLIPISARRQLNELSDEMAMKLSILYYSDAKEALLKALLD